MCVVIGCRALKSNNRFIHVVVVNLAHVQVVVVELILAAIDNVRSVDFARIPLLGKRIYLAEKSGCAILIESAGLRAGLAHHLIGCTQIRLNEFVEISLRICLVVHVVRVAVFRDHRQMLKNLYEVEVVECAERFQLTKILILVFLSNALSIVDGFHCAVHTRDGVIIILPFIEATYVVREDIGNLQLMDISLHRYATATFKSIVRANVKNPVRRRTCKSFVITEEMGFQTGISRS